MSYYKKIDGTYTYLASINKEQDSITYSEWLKQNSKEEKEDKWFSEQAYQELTKLENQLAFTIVDKDTDKMIGFIGLSCTQQMNQRSNLWIKMDPRISQDRQFEKGIEALHLMLDFSFNMINLHNIIIESPTNCIGNMEILKRSKMELFGIKHQAAHIQDNFFDNVACFQCTPQIYYNQHRKENSFAIEHLIKSNPKEVHLNEVSTMSNLVQGQSIELWNPTVYQEELEKNGAIPFFATCLMDPAISIPLGEFKSNWTDSTVKEYLTKMDYIIVINEQPIGYINTFRKDKQNRSAYLEIVIGSHSFQYKGFGKEALQLFLNEQYQHGIYNNISSNVFDFNTASILLHHSIGFNKVGTRFESYYANGKLHDIEAYEMTQDIFCENEPQKVKSLHPRKQ